MTKSAETAKLGLPTQLAYSLGYVGTNINSRGIAGFMLIFYNQVVGVAPALVSVVTLLMTVLDCFLDPAVGHISDHFHSRWGRRHPFMYLSVVPVTLCYILIWCPPQSWSHTAIFAYLLAVLLLLRVFGSCFELPSQALLPELTQDYNERTKVIGLCTMFGLIGATLMTVLAYQYFLKEAPGGHGGVLSRNGYLAYGTVSALVIGACYLGAALGTHRRIPYLSKPQQTSRPSLGAMAREVVMMMKNRSFAALMTSSITLAIGVGAKIGLDLYFQLYFWRLQQKQLSMLLIAGLAGTIVAVALATWMTRRWGKRNALTFVLVGGILCNVLPVLLRLVGLMPANGTSLLFGILFVDALLMYMLNSATLIFLTSMLNDVVEDIEVTSGHRSEGLLMAADNIARKLSGGFGIFVSGMVLTVIAFPRHAERGAVPPEILAKLAYAYIPITLFYLVSITASRYYRIDRNSHEMNLKTLRARQAGRLEPDPAGEVVA